MKKSITFGVFSLLALIATGCSPSNRHNDVVKETYIHKYGVPVAKTDWDEQGKDGQIIQLKKDGITLAQSFAQGILNGESTYTFPNSSTVHRVEVFEKGELVAKRENYTSGVPMWEETYKHGTLAKLTRWYEDGTPSATEIYQGNYLVKGEYRTPLNAVEASVEKGEGIRISRTNDGELLSKDTIHNGEMVERVTYFANGDPSVITPFEHGVIHGMRLTYLHGGLPRTAEQWNHGKQEGTTIVYQNGEKYAEVPYVNGKKNGVETRYRDGHLLVEELTWKDNVQHGQRKLYVDGATKSEWYHQGEMVSRATFERMNLPRA